jgi:hypothetical protein
VDDVEIVVIPPDIDEITDEDILENELIHTIVYDVNRISDVQ